MRGEQDYEAYVAARGATVVRCLLLLDLDLADAEDTAAESFALLRAEWHEVVETADPDVVLWATVLAVESRRRRRARVEPLTEDRVAWVLRDTAALEELQVCEVLGIPVPRLRGLLAARAPHPPTERDEPDGPDVAAVLALPYARVLGVAARRRRQRWLRTSAVAATTALAVGLVIVLSRPEPVQRPGDALPAVPVAEETNAAGVVWWADGRLHLAGSTLRVGTVRRLVAAGTGAAYVDGDGRLVGVTPDGERTLMGLPAEGSPLVSSPRLGLVAWADASVPDVTRLVVWDVEEGQEVAGVVTRPRVRPITFDGGWLRFGQGLTDWAWDPNGGPAQLTGDGWAEGRDERTALVDAVAGTRLEQFGTFLRVVRAGRRGETEFPGFGGSLSSDGRLVLTGPDEGREPHLYDAGSGEPLDPWGRDWHVVAAAFTDADRVAWVVDDQRGEGLMFVTCGTSVPISCANFVELGDPDKVLLAGDSRR